MGTKVENAKRSFERKVKRGAEMLNGAASVLRDVARDLERNAGDLVATEKEEHLCWAINNLASNLLGNCQLANMASIMAEIKLAKEELRLVMEEEKI